MSGLHSKCTGGRVALARVHKVNKYFFASVMTLPPTKPSPNQTPRTHTKHRKGTPAPMRV